MSQTEYVMRSIKLTEGLKQKLARDAKNSCQSSIKLLAKDVNEDGVDFALSPAQANKLDSARRRNIGVLLKIPKKVMRYNQSLQNGQEGGFLPLLAGLAAKAIPIASKVLAPLATGALSGLASTGIGKLFGNGLYLKKGGEVFQLETDGEGLFLKPHRGRGLESHGDGLFLRHQGRTYDGKGLLFGENSPFNFLGAIPGIGSILTTLL